MRLCIVPMKPLARAKERLAEVLTTEQRRTLALAMLEDVTRAACALDEVWVLNSDPDAADVAARAGGHPRPDPAPGAGLNASLDAATADAIAAGFGGVLVVSSDCAAVTHDDVEQMSAVAGIALAPDAGGTGTNALWRSPPDAIPASFGADSRSAHVALARERGLPLSIVQTPRLALDVDLPEDLEEAAIAGGRATRAVLESLGYPRRRARR